MRNYLWLCCGALVLALAAVAAPQQEKMAGPPPPWAYGFTVPANPAGGAPAAAPAAAPGPEDTTPKHLPGSTLSFTVAQVGDRFGPADWYPSDHPTMPDLVAHGRKPDVWACGLCHYPNGKGRPENAGVTGLPVSYFIQTMNDFKNGARTSADTRKANTGRMIGFAKAMSDADIKAAAEYFGAMKWSQWIKVVETDTVPKTRNEGGMFLTLEGNDKEPLGQRIIEVPVNTEGTAQLRDPHSGFIAYVPVGSVKKGEALVTTGGNGKTTACAVCHGGVLQGIGPVPGIAGRGPSYLARQLYDMKAGVRNGEWTQLMKPVVAKLTNDDIVDVSAYLASLPVLATSAAAAPAGNAAAGGGNALVGLGKAKFNSYGCDQCHGANGEGTDDAPDLVSTKKNAEQIAAFLEKPDSDARLKGMPNIEATSPDLQPLVAFVLSLKK